MVLNVANLDQSCHQRNCFKQHLRDNGAKVARMIAAQEEFDLHSGFYQRDVTDGMRVSWNFLLTWKEVNLAKVQQKAPSNVSWRYVLCSYAERFNVMKCSERCESTGSCRATATTSV